MLILLSTILAFNIVTLGMILGMAIRQERMEAQNLVTIQFLRTKLGKITPSELMYDD